MNTCNLEIENSSTGKVNKKSKVLTIFYRIVCVIIILICLCFIAFNIIFDYNKIDGKSMQPTYNYPNSNAHDIAYYSTFFTPIKEDIIVAKKNGYNVIKQKCNSYNVSLKNTKSKRNL